MKKWLNIKIDINGDIMGQMVKMINKMKNFYSPTLSFDKHLEELSESIKTIKENRSLKDDNLFISFFLENNKDLNLHESSLMVVDLWSDDRWRDITNEIWIEDTNVFLEYGLDALLDSINMGLL